MIQSYQRVQIAGLLDPHTKSHNAIWLKEVEPGLQKWSQVISVLSRLYFSIFIVSASVILYPQLRAAGGEIMKMGQIQIGRLGVPLSACCTHANFKIQLVQFVSNVPKQNLRSVHSVTIKALQAVFCIFNFETENRRCLRFSGQ